MNTMQNAYHNILGTLSLIITYLILLAICPSYFSSIYFVIALIYVITYFLLPVLYWRKKVDQFVRNSICILSIIAFQFLTIFDFGCYWASIPVRYYLVFNTIPYILVMCLVIYIVGVNVKEENYAGKEM